MLVSMVPRLRRGNITRMPPVRQRHSSTSTSGPNHDLIQLLKRYKAAAEASDARNPYKVRAYERAIKAVARMDEPARSGAQVKRLGGVGDRIAKRIDAFISNVPYDATNPTKSTQNAERSYTSAIADDGAANGMAGPKDKGSRSQYIHALQIVPGIGKQRAETLYSAGSGIFDLLTPAQQICARFAGRLSPTVSLEDAESVHVQIRIRDISSKYEVILVGDHQPSSEGITLLIAHPFDTELTPPKESYDATKKPPKLRPTQFFA
ncbi:hypothetical protein EDC04DRAFT_2615300, partial [Pisolithus marmoratus]